MGREQDDSLRRKLEQQYGDGGRSASWAQKDVESNPTLPNDYFALLVQEGIIPREEELGGFTFLSPSANTGRYEYEMAKALDASLAHQPTPQPRFIASEIVGNLLDSSQKDPLSYVAFETRTEDARELSLPPRSVDVIWDRLGAVWHLQRQRIDKEESSTKEVVRLLERYKNLLKPGGRVILDATDETSTMGVLERKDVLPIVSVFDSPEDQASTAQLNREIQKREMVYKIDLQKLGWEIHYIGDGPTRLAVLEPQRFSKLNNLVRRLGR